MSLSKIIDDGTGRERTVLEHFRLLQKAMKEYAHEARGSLELIQKNQETHDALLTQLRAIREELWGEESLPQEDKPAHWGRFQDLRGRQRGLIDELANVREIILEQKAINKNAERRAERLAEAIEELLRMLEKKPLDP